MLKKLSIFFWVIEGLLGLGAYGLDYFTRAKMGMARYVILRSNQFEKAFDVEVIQNVVLTLLILVLVVQLAFYIRHKKRANKLLKLNMSLAILIMAVCLLISSRYHFQIMRSYYFVIGPLLLASIVQLVNTGISSVGILKDENL